jgi:hypothetical protein
MENPNLTKAASLPRPLRYRARTKLKLTMKIMKGMKNRKTSCPSWLNNENDKRIWNTDGHGFMVILRKKSV